MKWVKKNGAIARRVLIYIFIFQSVFIITAHASYFEKINYNFAPFYAATISMAAFFGANNISTFVKENLVKVENFLFRSILRVRVFFLILLIISILCVSISFCILSKFNHQKTLLRLVSNFEENQNFSEFISDNTNKEAVYKLYQRYPNRLDWKVAISYMIAQKRLINDNDFRELSRNFVTWMYGLDSFDEFLNKDIMIIDHKKPFCWCSKGNFTSSSSSAFIVKLMNQGSFNLPNGIKRANLAERLLFISHPDNEELRAEQRNLLIYSALNDAHRAIDSGTEAEKNTISNRLKNLSESILDDVYQSEKNKFFKTDIYFQTVDLLAQIEIYRCSLGEVNSLNNMERLYQHFFEMREKIRKSKSEQIIWLSEPEKYMIFAYIKSYAGEEITEKMRKTLDYLDKLCSNYQNYLIESLRDRYEDYFQPSKFRHSWQSNTISSIGNAEAFRTLQKQESFIGSWRY